MERDLRHRGGGDGLGGTVPRGAAQCAPMLEALRTEPLSRENWNRQHQLRGRLATREWKGSALEQWEFEVTSGGRVRYLVSPETSTVILVYASTRHPKDTE
ncbi:hypothetical protein [Streptomyces sp. enrichment culture]|uniref:hypothetical protein n=1 Tax=Streptomyces sp. enrichment culture TaxID=1795815 RepID=UPI003F546F09